MSVSEKSPKRTVLSALFVVLFSLMSVFASASGAEKHDHEDKEFNATEVIMHHISDSHEFHILGEGKNSVSIPLPVIVFVPGKGLDMFMSSAFHHGEHNVITDKAEYILFHDKIYLANEKGELEFDEAGHPHNAKPIDFSITKNVFSMFLSVGLLLLIFLSVASAYKKNSGAPKGFQNAMETLILFVRDEIAIPNIGEKKYAKFMPYLLTVFFFIWINNLIGIVPFFPGSANLSGNISFTLTLAVFTLIITNVFASKDYWGHIFWMPGVPVPVKILLAPIELIGVFTKPFALTVRLFANITAGHIVVLSLISLIFILKTIWVSPASVALALFIDCLELLVAFLQAFVFTMLSALFIGAAVQEHHHDDHEHGEVEENLVV